MAELLDQPLSVLLGSGDGTFAAKQSFTAGPSAPGNVEVGDFNGDGVVDVVTADFGTGTGSTVSVLFGNSLSGVSALQRFSLATRDGARAAMTYFAQVQTRVSSQRGIVGAFESRAQYAASTLSVSSEEFSAAESRITDADIAEESANLVKLQILQQAGAAVLSQANQGPALALVLLKAV
jgi:flagellin-like hook-associated protein FlgL